MREAAITWGDNDKRYLASAVTFVDKFRGWDFGEPDRGVATFVNRE